MRTWTGRAAGVAAIVIVVAACGVDQHRPYFHDDAADTPEFSATRLGDPPEEDSVAKVLLTQRMSVGFTESVERSIYDDGRKDWIWGTWGNASYLLFRWLTVSLEASYTRDHSNISSLDYNEYRGIFRITATSN